MYKILVDGKILYDPILASDGYAITSGSIDAELGYAGTASITVPPTNPQYSTLKKMRSILQIFQDEEEAFFGRVLHDEKDFYKNNSLYMEGQLSFFADYIMPPHNMQTTIAGYLQQVIGVYNTQAEATKQVQVGLVTIQETAVLEFNSVEFMTIQDALYTPLIDVYGGYFRVRYDNGVHYLDYLAYGSESSMQQIEFGKNLHDLSDYATAEDTVTVVIPLGAMTYDQDDQPAGRVNITSVTEGNVEYVTDAQAAALYGNIWRAVVWDDVEDPAQLKQLGEEYLAEHKAESITITIGAVDLHLINPEIDSIKLGDLVRVVSAPHGINAVYQCTKIHIDLLSPSQTSYTLGAPLKTISGMQADAAAAIQTMEEGAADSTLQYIALSERVAAAEAEIRKTKIQHSDKTTISAIYADVQDLSVGYYYLGAEVTDRPGNTGGTLAIYRATDQYGALMYYANDGKTWRGGVAAGTLVAFQEIELKASS